MRILFTAPDSKTAFESLRATGITGRILLHRMPHCTWTFEALVGPVGCGSE